jgi:hypothetical protein
MFYREKSGIRVIEGKLLTVVHKKTSLAKKILFFSLRPLQKTHFDCFLHPQLEQPSFGEKA